MKNRLGNKVTMKQFFKRWWKGIQEVKLFKDINKEVKEASKIYNA
jgi:hypothetical protein